MSDCDGILGKVSNESTKDCGGYLCFNLGKHRVEFPQGFTRDQIVTSVLEESLESRKEIFEGIKPKDLYATNAYRNGDLTGVSFFPNRMKAQSIFSC